MPNEAEKPMEPEKKIPKSIQQANEAAARLEAANTRYAELLGRQEALQVEKTLGGEADAGTKERTAEDEAIDAAKRQLKGTGFDEMLFPSKE